MSSSLSEAAAKTAATSSTATTCTLSPQPPATVKPNLDGILLVEQPFLRVPFEELRRQQRTQQRLIERDMVACTHTLNEISKSKDSNRDEMVKGLDSMLRRLNGLKRKLGPLTEQSKHSLRMAQSRTDHLSSLHNIDNCLDPEFAEWSNTRLERMLTDYMLRRGYRGSANQLANNRGIQDLADLELFVEIANIEDSLLPPDWSPKRIDDDLVQHQPSCTLALAWCSENKASLRKIKSPLEFNLRLQEFIQLARVRTTESIKEAIAYARRHLLPLLATAAQSNNNNSKEKDKDKERDRDKDRDDKEVEYERLAQEAIHNQVSRAMGLLACGPTGWAYEDLYNPKRWQMLRDSFRACALQIRSLPPQPILHIALSAGLSSLKVPTCYNHEPFSESLAALRDSSQPGDVKTLSSMTDVTATTSGILLAPSFPQSTPFPPAMGGGHPDLTFVSDLIVRGSSFPPVSSDRTSTTQTMTVITKPIEGDHSSHLASFPPLYSPSALSSRLYDRNIDCPICDLDGLGTLAKEVPFSHHANSTLVCSLSGTVMDENNPPMCLPNGRVYAQSALEEMAAKSEDGMTIVCPRTGFTCSYSSLRKVFIS